MATSTARPGRHSKATGAELLLFLKGDDVSSLRVLEDLSSGNYRATVLDVQEATTGDGNPFRQVWLDLKRNDDL